MDEGRETGEVVKRRPQKGYRPCVGIALFSRDGRLFLGKRAQKGVLPEYSWQMPQGGIDAGEAPLTAARRELFEETGVSSVKLLSELNGWLHYDLPSELAAWRGRYRGQAQRWYAFRFLGEDHEINVTEPPDGHPQEFSEWRWASLDEAPRLVVPFKRAVYYEVANAFRRFEGRGALHGGARAAI